MVKYWVTMTDKFLSGWGRAQGQKAKYIYECESYEEALTVQENAEGRGDQKYINICTTKPYYNSRDYHIEWKNKENCPLWYKKGYFKR
jgi:hypothetical protein